MEVTGRMSELRENAEYLVWYVKKPVFTKKKFQRKFQSYLRSVVVVVVVSPPNYPYYLHVVHTRTVS